MPLFMDSFDLRDGTYRDFCIAITLPIAKEVMLSGWLLHTASIGLTPSCLPLLGILPDHLNVSPIVVNSLLCPAKR